ncbi:MAG: dTDP-4-dehydrorhamnose 3,5-epimerase family protein [Vulcanimicrobiota bacterium]
MNYISEPEKTQIDGLCYTAVYTHIDDRGTLQEVLRRTDPNFTKFGQIYIVGNLTRGVIRAFHKHLVLTDYSFLSHGSGIFNYYDDRPDSSSYGKKVTLVTGRQNPMLITVPPGVYHGFMSLEDDTQLISISSEVYNRKEPDKVLAPPNSFGFDWEISAK